MKKNLFFLVLMVLLGSCTDQKFMAALTGETSASNSAKEFRTLMEQARWGDGQAYLKLADCYRDGKGTEQDLICMICMLKMAEQFGGIGHVEDYLETLPEDSEFRLVFETIELFSRRRMEEAKAKIEQLNDQKMPDGYTMKGIFAMESGDTLEAIRLVKIAATKGSHLAELLMCGPEWHGGTSMDMVQMKKVAEKNPFACSLLAMLYTGNGDEIPKNEQLAAYYFLKADEQAFLGREGARWLLDYHRNGGYLQLSEKDLQRLRTLSGEDQEDNISDVEQK